MSRMDSGVEMCRLLDHIGFDNMLTQLHIHTKLHYLTHEKVHMFTTSYELLFKRIRIEFQKNHIELA